VSGVSCSLRQQVLKQGLLGMQAIFCFVPDDTLWPVNHLSGDFFATVSWQAVHKQRIVCCGFHEIVINLVTGKSLFP